MERRNGFLLGMLIILGAIFLFAFIEMSSIWKDNQIPDNQIVKILMENPARNIADYDDFVDRQNDELLNEELWSGNFENELTQKLMSVGDPAVEPLIQALENENWKVRRTAAVALGKMGCERAVDPLIKILQEDDGKLVVMAAAVALGEIGDERAIEPLLEVLTERKDYNVTPHIWGDDLPGDTLEPYYTTVPCRAAEVLIKMGLDERAIEPFILSLNYIDTQEIAIFALGEIGDEGIIELLFEVFKDPKYTGGSEIICMRSTQTSKSIVSISQRVGEPAIDILIQGMKDEDVLVRKGAANTLGMLGQDAKKAVPALMEVARTDYENFGSSYSYVEGYGGSYAPSYAPDPYGTRGASASNVNNYNYGDSEFSPYNCLNQYEGAGPEAVEALINIGDERAIEPISQTLRNENRNREIQKQIISAIRRTNNSNAIEILRVALGTEHSVVKNAAISALEDIGGKEAIRVLTYASYDKNSHVRENAVRALEKLQEAK